MQLAEIIRTDCTVRVPPPDAELAPEVPPVIAPVEPEPVVPLPLVVEPVEPDPEAVEPVDEAPLPIAPEALLSVPRISTWWPTCFCSSALSPPDRR